MAASKSAQTATSGVGARSRVNARARGRLRTPVEGGFVRSRYAPASEQTIADAVALLDRHRPTSRRDGDAESGRSWARTVAASFGAVALTVFTGTLFAALIAASVFGLIVAILNTHR